MIPSITPPTDNLYKFISLFGLAIFLFATYNLSIVYDQSTENKMHIEDLKVEVQKKIYAKSHTIHSGLTADSSGKRFRPAKIKRLDSDLHSIDVIISTANLDQVEAFELKGKVSKLNVGLDTLALKQGFCIGFVGIGIVIMIFGFWRWQKREQNIRDKILRIEHALKIKERNGKIKHKKNKVAVPSFSNNQLFAETESTKN